ncbi:MAG: hypothetical protein ABUT39_12430 [Acidobacteriota bacterium]
MKNAPKAPPLPTPISRRLVRYVVGFGIAVGVGMAPFLGRVPGVGSLLELFPPDMRRTLIPLSVFLMGIVAVAVQFYSAEAISRAALRRRFSLALTALLAGLLVLLGLYAVFVETVSVSKGELMETRAVVTGADPRTPSCGCPQELSNAECVKNLSLNPAAIDSCWGRSLRLVRFSLSLSYLLLTGGFGALVGLLLLQEESRRAKEKRSRPPAAASTSGL